jgi:hypothetical protein
MLMANRTSSGVDGNEKVAYDLMKLISEQEADKVAEKTRNPRKYYLELYAQCIKIVSGEDLEDVFDSAEQ